MSDQSEAAKRSLEVKPGGSNPESPHKKQTQDVDMEGAPGWVRQLMKKMDNVEAKVEGVETKVDGMSAKVDEAVQAATKASEDVKDIEMKVDGLQTKVNYMEADLKEQGVKKEEWIAWRTGVEEKIAATEFKEPMEELTPDVKQKLDDIEKQLAGMKSKTKPHAEDRVVTMVVGGVGTNGDGDQAMDWLGSQIQAIQIRSPEDIYFKGDDFKGMLFCKFDQPEAAEKAIKELSKRKPEFKAGGSVFKPWFKQDVPISERAPLSFLLGLRWQLGEWGTYDKKIIKVDEKELTMTINKQEVAHVSTQSGSLQVEWRDEEWKMWKELQESSELKALVEAANKKIGQAKDNEAKGKGKGKGPKTQ